MSPAMQHTNIKNYYVLLRIKISIWSAYLMLKYWCIRSYNPEIELHMMNIFFCILLFFLNGAQWILISQSKCSSTSVCFIMHICVLFIICHRAPFTDSLTVLTECAKYDTHIEMQTEEEETGGRGSRTGNLRGVEAPTGDREGAEKDI